MLSTLSGLRLLHARLLNTAASGCITLHIPQIPSNSAHMIHSDNWIIDLSKAWSMNEKVMQAIQQTRALYPVIPSNGLIVFLAMNGKSAIDTVESSIPITEFLYVVSEKSFNLSSLEAMAKAGRPPIRHVITRIPHRIINTKEKFVSVKDGKKSKVRRMLSRVGKWMSKHLKHSHKKSLKTSCALLSHTQPVAPTLKRIHGSEPEDTQSTKRAKISHRRRINLKVHIPNPPAWPRQRQTLPAPISTPITSSSIYSTESELHFPRRRYPILSENNTYTPLNSTLYNRVHVPTTFRGTQLASSPAPPTPTTHTLTPYTLQKFSHWSSLASSSGPPTPSPVPTSFNAFSSPTLIKYPHSPPANETIYEVTIYQKGRILLLTNPGDRPRLRFSILPLLHEKLQHASDISHEIKVQEEAQASAGSSLLMATRLFAYPRRERARVSKCVTVAPICGLVFGEGGALEVAKGLGLGLKRD